MHIIKHFVRYSIVEPFEESISRKMGKIAATRRIEKEQKDRKEQQESRQRHGIRGQPWDSRQGN